MGFIGRVHGQAVEVFRKAGLDCGFGTVFEHKAGNLMVAGEDLLVRECQHRASPPLTRFHLELALGSGSDDEVLQQAMSANARCKFSVCTRIAVTTDISGRLNELIQRDRFDHGTHS